MVRTAETTSKPPEPCGVAVQRMVGRHVTHLCKMPEVKGGKIAWWIDRRDVVLMAVAGKYAMVRRPRAMPYVASLSEIEVPPNSY